VQYVFLELPKYRAGEDPQGLIDRWAYFFREAENLDMVPSALAGPPFSEALEVARIANFTAMELEIYDQSKIEEQDARGALSLAVRQGREAGLAEGREEGLAEGREEGLAEGREEGLAEGREEGRAEGREAGRAEALRLAVRALCGAFGIEIDARREATLATMGAPELEALQQRLLDERSWS
jgi:flagellar biosynthesis/type III secretory pathway protein FliH